jgi:hypothetical protein
VTSRPIPSPGITAIESLLESAMERVVSRC